MASEQFSLCWDNFHKNMSLGMQSLLENEDLVDVTLAVEGRYLKAHKMVLSVCSPYFRELFQTNPCKHPIVFMKDVSYIALSDLLQFMYQGEVQVAQESLPTFIKTAEALQIKGLTGDGGNQNESEMQEETSETEQPTETKRMYDIETKTVPGSSRIKRLSSASASKRPKFTVSSEASANSSKTALVVTKTEISGNTNATTTSGDTLKFKMEPSESTDQSQVEEGVDDSQIDTFDESNIDDTQDDIEEYSLMETGDDEPKPGTSADGAGDSQDYMEQVGEKRGKKKMKRMRYVYNGFVYHTSVVRANPAIRYLICSKYGSTGCHARAILPLGADTKQLRVTRTHNHPPDHTAEEKFTFLSHLKEVTQASANSPLKLLFEGVLSLYPKLASEMHFDSIRTSMRRWRKEALEFGVVNNS